MKLFHIYFRGRDQPVAIHARSEQIAVDRAYAEVYNYDLNIDRVEVVRDYGSY